MGKRFLKHCLLCGKGYRNKHVRWKRMGLCSHGCYRTAREVSQAASLLAGYGGAKLSIENLVGLAVKHIEDWCGEKVTKILMHQADYRELELFSDFRSPVSMAGVGFGVFQLQYDDVPVDIDDDVSHTTLHLLTESRSVPKSLQTWFVEMEMLRDDHGARSWNWFRPL